jgi:hypothetical protein
MFQAEGTNFDFTLPENHHRKVTEKKQQNMI